MTRRSWLVSLLAAWFVKPWGSTPQSRPSIYGGVYRPFGKWLGPLPMPSKRLPVIVGEFEPMPPPPYYYGDEVYFRGNEMYLKNGRLVE